MNSSIQEKYPQFFTCEVVGAKEFLDLQIKSKETYPEHIQKKITIRDLEDLKKATCISINNGDGLLCVTNEGDIESVLKKNNAKLDGFLNIAFVNAINNGGNRLDCYNCAGANPGKGSTLGDNYAKRGFLPVCRIRFNRLYVDPLMAKTYGEPEVIFFIYCEDPIEEYIDKLVTKQYPELSFYKYIPYIDEIQDLLSMDSDDMDYCFALHYRNVISEKWRCEYKDKCNGDFNQFAEYTQIHKDEVASWLAEKYNKIQKEVYPEMSIMSVLSSQIDENGEFMDLDGIHLLLNALGEDAVDELKKKKIEAPSREFYLTNYYHFNVNEPEGLLTIGVNENNTYLIGENIYYVDVDETGERVGLFSYTIDNDGNINEEYSFNNHSLVDICFESTPFLVYKEGLLWFIDKNNDEINTIYSFDPKDKTIHPWPIDILNDVLVLFPIHLQDNTFVYLYSDEHDLYDTWDYSAVQVKEKETTCIVRVGEIVGINDTFIYSNYGGTNYYRLELQNMRKKSLQNLNLCECDVDIVFIDASRDIVYSRILEPDPDFQIDKEEMEQIKKHLAGLNFDTFTRGKIEETVSQIPPMEDYTPGQYRFFGDEDLIGIDYRGIPVKIWAVNEETPPCEEYDCTFRGEGFKYYSRP